MTKETALKLIGEYADRLRERGIDNVVLTDILGRWPEDGSERKSMRWLGFMQGAAYVQGVFTLDEIKEHSRNGAVDKSDNGNQGK